VIARLREVIALLIILALLVWGVGHYFGVIPSP
jgi:hypothetical protein